MRLAMVVTAVVLGAGMTAFGAMGSRRRFARPPEREAEEGDVRGVVDEAVHAPDAPDTVVKQAFEHALEGR